MIRERGAMLQLVEYDRPTDGTGQLCTVTPRASLCKKCHILFSSWHPKPPPTVGLCLTAETLTVGLLGVIVLHEALVDLLGWHCPGAQFARCTSVERSPLNAGARYYSASLPASCQVITLYPAGAVRFCPGCKREICSMGPGARDPYIVLSPEQEHAAVVFDPYGGVLLSPQLRREVEAISQTPIGWITTPVYSERLPQHVVASPS